MDTIKGIILKEKHQKAPDFVICRGSINVGSLQEFLSQQRDEWINFDILRGKDGKPYIKIDTWKPTPKNEGFSGF